jgi:carbon monoxide dehydrogenase subunit G
MKITSEKAVVQASNTEILEFLSNSENLYHLLPEDKISDWEASTEQCSFKVQGGIMITLLQNGKEEPNKLFLKSGEKSPFPFELTVHLTPVEKGTEGYIEFDGKMNMFIKMMAEKPLTALFNHMTAELQNYYANKNV